MRNLALVLCFSFLAALSASAAGAQSWTATASTGAVDESSQAIYAVSTTDINYLSTSTSTSSITVRYNVTCEGDDTPAWTTFEILADNAGLTNGVVAVLYSFPRNATGNTLVAAIGSTAGTGLANYSTTVSGLNCANNYYVVEATISRSSSSSQPRLRGVRLY
jgi:hypothetical protein